MSQFDLRKFLIENKLTSNSKELNEGVLKDLGSKVKPELSKIFSTGKAKSKQVYNVVKKQVKDPENAEIALKAITKAYNGIKNVADKTLEPKRLKAIQKFIPGIKTTLTGTIVVAAYQTLFKGTFDFSNILKPDVSFGDPTIALTIGKFLVALKVSMYVLQFIANIRKGKSALKGIFNENEDAMANVDFSDIESIFN